MKARGNLATGSMQHPHADRGDDCYETPPCALEALMRVEDLPRVIWEPACGPGALVTTLRAAGHVVTATDINSYGCPESNTVDFFMCGVAPPNTDCILTNPPFKIAQKFIEHALKLCPTVYMLGRLTWLESTRRTSILENGRLAKVYVFRNRLPMMHRRGWEGPKNTSTVAYAWFCWVAPGIVDETELHRISWT